MNEVIRVVVDLTGILPPQGPGRFYDALAAMIAGAPPWVALVVTTAQLGKLPRDCAPDDRVKLETVTSSQAGEVAARRLAEGGAVVVSPWRFDPITRWVALDNRCALEPRDALTLLRDGASFDPPPPSEDRELSLWLDEVNPASPPSQLTSTPAALRRLLAVLATGSTNKFQDPATEGQYEADAAKRLAWANALGVKAYATKGEWQTLLLQKAHALGAVVMEVGSEATLTAHRAKVAQGGKVPRAVMIGDALHLVQPNDAQRSAFAMIKGVHFHDDPVRASALARLRQTALETSREAWLDDPYLDAALERMDPQGTDRDELEFVRAALLLHEKLVPPEATCSRDWRKALAAVLAHDPPQVALRVPQTERWARESRHDAEQQPHTLLPGDLVARRQAARAEELLGIPALAPPRVTREAGLQALYRSRIQLSPFGYAPQPAPVDPQRHRYLLPTEACADDVEMLIDLFQHAPSRATSLPGHDSWWRDYQNRHLGALQWEVQPIETSSAFWAEADRTLGLVWMVLRRAVKHAEAITLHDGVGLLELGGGLVAEVRATSRGTGTSDELEADIECDLRAKPYEDNSRAAFPKALALHHVLHGVATHTAYTNGGYTTAVTLQVPRALHLAFGDQRLRITFATSPWATGGDKLSGIAGVVGGVLRAADDAAASADWD